MKKETYMKNNMQSYNLFLIINVAICSLLDFIIAIAIMANQFNTLSCIVAILLVILDITLVLKCIFTNFHFKYHLYELIVHVSIFIIALLLFITTFGKLTSATTYMNTFSSIIFIVAHLVHLISYVAMIPFARKKQIKKNKVASIIILAIYVAVVGFYSIYLIQNGVFGQTTERRSLVNQYLYNEEDDTYSIIDYQGRGTIISVPDTFDGKPVVSITINERFITGTPIEIYFDGEEQYPTLILSDEVLANPENLNTKFHVKKGTIRTFQEYLFNTFDTSISANILNNVEPSHDEDNSVYIDFFYDVDTLNFIKSSYPTGQAQLFPTWIGSRGEVFTDSFLDSTEYGQMAKSLNSPENSFEYFEENLASSYQRFNGFVLSPLKLSSGDYLVGSAINQSEVVNVKFEAIYDVNFVSDNDEYYENESYKYLCGDQNLTKKRYATYQYLDQILENYPGRDGFELRFYNNESRIYISSLATHIDSYGMTTIDIQPAWTLIPTSISSVTTSSPNNQFTYGDNVTMNVLTTSSPVTGIEYIYELYKDGNLIAREKSLRFNNVDPSFSGNYSVRAISQTNSNSMITSCTASSNLFPFDINVSKRTIEVDCDEQFTYNASTQTITLKYDESIIINNDEIAFDIMYNNSSSMRDAGNYDVDVKIVDGADKYEIVVLFDTVNVAPYVLNVTWDPLQTFTYDGYAHAPTYSISNSLSETVDFVKSGEQINANYQSNQYTYTISLNNTDANNYRLNDIDTISLSRNYTITKRIINSIGYENNQSSFVYNASQQAPVVISLGNVASTDNQLDIINSLIYEFSTTNKAMPQNNGSYTMTMSLPTNSNYVLSSSIATKSFIIEKQIITLTYTGGNKTYNGQAQSLAVQILDAANVTEARNDLIYTQGVSSQQGSYSRTNAGVYDTVVSLSSTSNYRLSANYRYSVEISRYEITDMALAQNHFIYNGEERSVQVQTTTTTLYRNLQFTYTFDKTPLNAGTYNVTVTYNDPNYVSKEHKFVVTIDKLSITPNYQNPNWTYDGSRHTATLTSSNIVGALSKDVSSIIDSLSYTNNTATNAGNYTFTVALPSTSNYQLTGTTSFTYSILKREITLDYTAPSLTYDGTLKTVMLSGITNAVSSQTQSVIDSLRYTDNSATAAGSYTFTVTIDAISYPMIDQNYQIIGPSSFIYSIAKKDITLVYNEPTLTYNGLLHTVTISSVEGTVLDQEEAVLNSLIYSGNSQTNAGNYTFTVALPTTSNYQIAGTRSFNYSIAKKDITLVYYEPILTYNGSLQTAILSGVEGTVNDEEDEVLNSIIYNNNSQANAGSYTFTVALPTTSNYKIVGQNTFNYSIGKKYISLVYQEPTLTYNGLLQTVTITDVEGAVQNQQQAVLNSLIYNGNSQTNVGDYSFTVAIPSTSNYQIEGTNTFNYSIRKKDITLVYSEPTLTYNGSSQTVSITSVEGAVLDQEEAVLNSLIYSGNSQTNVGNYSFTVAISPTSNYQIIGPTTFNYSIVKKGITLGYTAPSLTYNGTSQIVQISSIDGELEGDEAMILSTLLVYTGNEEVDAGTYNFTVTLLDNPNYLLLDEGEFEFTIARKEITSITFTSSEYNGQNQKPEILSVEGLVSLDDVSEINEALQSAIMNNEYINASTYQILITLSDTSNYIIEQSFAYTIAKQKISLVANEDIIIYDGEEHQFDVEIEGATDNEEAKASLIFVGDTTGSEVGEYTFTVSIGNDNYQLTDNGQPIEEITFTYYIQEAEEE